MNPKVGLLLNRIVTIHSSSNHEISLLLAGQFFGHLDIDRKSSWGLRFYEECIAFVDANLAESIATRLVEDAHLERVSSRCSRRVCETIKCYLERFKRAQASVHKSFANVDDPIE